MFVVLVVVGVVFVVLVVVGVVFVVLVFVLSFLSFLFSHPLFSPSPLSLPSPRFPLLLHHLLPLCSTPTPPSLFAPSSSLPQARLPPPYVLPCFSPSPRLSLCVFLLSFFLPSPSSQLYHYFTRVWHPTLVSISRPIWYTYTSSDTVRENDTCSSPPVLLFCRPRWYCQGAAPLGLRLLLLLLPFEESQKAIYLSIYPLRR